MESSSVIYSKEILGSHGQQIDTMIKDWSELPCYHSYKGGLRLLDCVKKRKNPFLFSNEEFMYPDFKPAELSDILHDIGKMDTESDCGAVNMGTGLLVDQDKVPDGREMVRRFMEHLVRNEEKSFNQVVLPLSCPILSPCPETQWGVGGFDLRQVVPKNLESYVEDFNGWKGSLVCAPSYTKIKNETFLCGRVIVHMFGRKVWVFGPPDDDNMTIMNKDDGTEDKTSSFITQSRNLLVLDCRRPCVLFIPPNFFCANLTFNLASSISCRLGSLFWLPEMGTSLNWLKISQEEFVTSAIRLVNLELDANIWFHWFRNKGNDLSEEQVEFVKGVSCVLTGLTRARKSFIETTNATLRIDEENPSLKDNDKRENRKLLGGNKADPGNSSNLGVASAINRAISSNKKNSNVFGCIRRPRGSTTDSEMEETDTDI